ncbi:MAG: AAA family ATPase, partial [Chthoniobacter sp.]|uniref:AAA family ATPase n=1 Tax=Chthoniobacter sp. TaxID=2510640 RepID=UPI0032ACF25A
DPAEPTLSSDDEFAWWRMFSQPGAGPILAARWETIDDQVSRSANFRAELEDEETKRITLTRGQEECAAELEGYWHALINGGQASGYRLRPPLLVAPSGSGKSRLVGWLADKLRVPLYVVDTSSWMISGSRADMGTLKLLEAWHAANDRGLVLIDEIDKADGREVGWWKNVNMEMMCYIDGRIQWPRRLLRKLRSQFLIIGAGTWQHEHRQEQRPLGFANGRSGNVLVAIESTFGTDQSIPEELAFRFDTPLILAPPTHEEFAERIAAIRSELMLPALSTECLAALCADAVASRRGQRFIEGYAGRMLRDRARCAQVAECFDF